MRSSRLREAISPGLSYRTFSDSVRRLQRKGFVERVEFPMEDGRVAVEYRLTEQGALVVDLLLRVDRWADTHSEDLPDADPDGSHPDRRNATGTRSVDAAADSPAPRRPPTP